MKTLLAWMMICGSATSLCCQTQRSASGSPVGGHPSKAEPRSYKVPTDALPGSGNRIPAASFRIVFGLRDTAPAAWDGELLVEPGQSIDVEADRFRDYQYEEKSWNKGIVSIKLPDPALPNDYLRGKTGWVVSTRYSPLHGPTTEWHDYGQIDNVRGHDALKPVLVQPSVLLHLGCDCLDMPVHIRTVKGDFSFIPRQILDNGSRDFLDNAVRVSSVAPGQDVAPERLGQQDFPAVLSTATGTLWVAWQEYDGVADRLVVRGRAGVHWNSAVVLEKGADIFKTGLAEDAAHRIWAVWSMQVNGRWDLYARVFDGSRWSERKRMTFSDAAKNIFHVMTADSDGRVWLVWQRIDRGYSQIFAKSLVDGKWSAGEQISSGPSASGNNWWPSVAAGPGGSLVVAWDGYSSGNYDVYMRRRADGRWGKEEAVTHTALFEAHPTVAIDRQKRVWVAWDQSGANWGKEVGFLAGMQGTPLHNSRSIRLICFDGDRRLTTQEDIQQVFGTDGFWELPHLQVDTEGRPWVFARHMVMREPDTPMEDSNNLSLWDIWATRYDGQHWMQPMYLPHSSGRNDMTPASANGFHGDLWAVWPTDDRDTKDYQPQQQKVRIAVFHPADRAQPTQLRAYQADVPKNVATLDPKEAEQVRRIRAYRIHINGKTYSIYRGDMHRHTDISVDGNNDGSLLDAFRYARDAASLDFLGVTNHTDDIWDAYNWWRTQKVDDLFNVDHSFVDFYGYERSVEWPNGHRNIFFIKRGAPILPIGAFEAREGYVGSESLYAYLRRNGGFSIPHTTGRTSGTDWRDNDSTVEPVMEIYQGMRDSYEYPESPRPFKLSSTPDASGPVPRASSAPDSPSFKPLGFAWNALEKGYKLGFIASSDHISTHVSYACVLAEDLTRESLDDAIHHRRTYAATANIIMDIRFEGSDGAHLMGDVFSSRTPLKIMANILGTGDLLQIDIIEDGAIIKTYKPAGSDAVIEFNDPNSSREKEHYFYVRVMQKDGNMSWSSPVWASYTP